MMLFSCCRSGSTYRPVVRCSVTVFIYGLRTYNEGSTSTIVVIQTCTQGASISQDNTCNEMYLVTGKYEDPDMTTCKTK